MQLLAIYLTVPLMLCLIAPVIDLCIELTGRGQQ